MFLTKCNWSTDYKQQGCPFLPVQEREVKFTASIHIQERKPKGEKKKKKDTKDHFGEKEKEKKKVWVTIKMKPLTKKTNHSSPIQKTSNCVDFSVKLFFSANSTWVNLSVK